MTTFPGTPRLRPSAPSRAAPRRPAVVWFLASVFLTMLAHTSLYAFFSPHMVEIGYSKSAVGPLRGRSQALYTPLGYGISGVIDGVDRAG